MVDANIDNGPKATIIAARSHDDNVWIPHLSHLVTTFNKVEELAS